MRSAIAILGCLMLAACVSPQEQAARSAARQEQANTMDDNQCRSYGAVPGSDAYIRCRMMISQQRSASNAQSQAIAAQFLLNRQQNAVQPVPVYQMPVRQQTNCTTNYVGTQSYTNCN